MKNFILLLLISGSAVLSYPSKKQRCCSNGEPLLYDKTCGKDTEIKMECDGDLYLLEDIIVEGDKLTLQDFPNYTFVDDVSLYCIGEMYRNESQKELGLMPVALICYPQMSTEEVVTSILGFISVFFFGVTLAVYMYLPKLRDLHGLCYMCLCISMGLGYLSMSILQVNTDLGELTCHIGAFFAYFWLMATFFWMNVISINTYRSIVYTSYMKISARKQFFRYSCYAWGSSQLLLFVALITHAVEGDHWKPGFGEYSCWFSGWKQSLIFFFIPMGVLITANVVLFILSSYMLWRQHEGRHLNSLKFKFILTLKLFLVMGISWTFELASFLHDKPHIIWAIAGYFNSLQGVVIFLLLVVFRKLAIQGLVQESCCLGVTRPLVQKLSPDDYTDDERSLADETTGVEVRLD